MKAKQHKAVKQRYPQGLATQLHFTESGKVTNSAFSQREFISEIDFVSEVTRLAWFRILVSNIQVLGNSLIWTVWRWMSVLFSTIASE